MRTGLAAIAVIGLVAPLTAGQQSTGNYGRRPSSSYGPPPTGVPSSGYGPPRATLSSSSYWPPRHSASVHSARAPIESSRAFANNFDYSDGSNRRFGATPFGANVGSSRSTVGAGGGSSYQVRSDLWSPQQQYRSSVGSSHAGRPGLGSSLRTGSTTGRSFASRPNLGQSFSYGSDRGSSLAAGSVPGTSFSHGYSHGSSFDTGSNLGPSFDTGSNHGRSYDTGSNHGRSFDTGSNHGRSFDTGSNHGRSFDTGSNHGRSFATMSNRGPSFSTGSSLGQSLGTGSNHGRSFATMSNRGPSFSTGSSLGQSFGTGSSLGQSLGTGSSLGRSFATGSRIGSPLATVPSFGLPSLRSVGATVGVTSRAIPHVHLDSSTQQSRGVVSPSSVSGSRSRLVQTPIGRKSRRRGRQGLYFSWDVNPKTLYTWDEADNRCRTLGYRLVTIGSAKKDEFISNLIEENNIDAVWTSGTRQATGQFVWGDSTPVLGYTNWSETGGDGRPQPDNREGFEDCLSVLNYFYGDGITWHDGACHHRKHFVCETL